VKADFPPTDGRWKQNGGKKSISAREGHFWQKGEHNFDHALFSPLSRYKHTRRMHAFPLV
jgi:hypothetical protein